LQFAIVDLSRVSERMLLILYFIVAEAGKAQTIVTPSLCLQNDIGPSPTDRTLGGVQHVRGERRKLKLKLMTLGGETTSRRPQINPSDSRLVYHGIVREKTKRSAIGSSLQVPEILADSQKKVYK